MFDFANNWVQPHSVVVSDPHSVNIVKTRELYPDVLSYSDVQ